MPPRRHRRSEKPREKVKRRLFRRRKDEIMTSEMADEVKEYPVFKSRVENFDFYHSPIVAA